MSWHKSDIVLDRYIRGAEAFDNPLKGCFAGWGNWIAPDNTGLLAALPARTLTQHIAVPALYNDHCARIATVSAPQC